MEDTNPVKEYYQIKINDKLLSEKYETVEKAREAMLNFIQEDGLFHWGDYQVAIIHKIDHIVESGKMSDYVSPVDLYI